MIRKVSFGSSPRAGAQAQSAQLAQELIPKQMKSLDPFKRFGLTLFFTGAGDFVGTR